MDDAQEQVTSNLAEALDRAGRIVDISHAIKRSAGDGITIRGDHTRMHLDADWLAEVATVGARIAIRTAVKRAYAQLAEAEQRIDELQPYAEAVAADASQLAIDAAVPVAYEEGFKDGKRHAPAKPKWKRGTFHRDKHGRISGAELEA